MKILCLHGDGQNGEVFQSDLALILPKLQNSTVNLSLDFADAPLLWSNVPAKDSPCHELRSYKYYKEEGAKDIREAHGWLAEKLEQESPYDGVIAFAQGAALVSSFLLYRQWYDHELPPAFGFAIFIGGNIPLGVLKDLGVPVSNETEGVVAEAERQRDRGLGPSLTHAAKARRAVFNSDDCFGLNLNKMPLELKIRIPTVHVWGERDPLFPTSTQLAGLCDPYIRKIQVHGGAHEVPRDGKELTELAELVEWCIQRATWPGQMQL
ncbi:serine hydrolase FSH [Hypoxylon sp. NC1633]|nr:serine hydrolase FSH [Hypoxylon sp. NC1633]